MLKIIYRSAVLLSLTFTHLILCQLITTDVPVSLDLPSCSPCECENGNDNGHVIVDCSKKDLKEIPTNLPTTIVGLNLDDNVINFDVKDNICGIYKDLRTLSLARNKLDDDEVHDALQGCKTLEAIDLTGNTLAPDSLEKIFINLKNLVFLTGLTVSGTLKKDVFSPLQKLQHLDLTYEGLSFPVDLFADLKALRNLHLKLAKVLNVNASLKVDGLDELYLFGPKIKKLPSLFFSNLRTLTTLDLDLPQLNTLKWPDLEVFSSLKHLSIKSVWQVATSTLSGMKSLQTLQLTNIDSLEKHPDVFADQKNLEVLEITGCDLEELQSSWFSNLKSLYDLNVTDNKLTKLQPDSLNGLSNLRNIVLSFNKLIRIPRGFWDPVAQNLENISLKGNRLINVQKDDFPLMNNLMALDISENSLNKFDLDVSQQMPNLIHLQLQYNSITILIGSLGSKIRRVNISYNTLGDIPDGLFVESLIDLDISGNLITLEADEIMRHEYLKELTINDLTVKCDCAMQQLIKSKAVHGGKCISNGNAMNLRDVGDILNESLCDESKSTTTSSFGIFDVHDESKSTTTSSFGIFNVHAKITTTTQSSFDDLTSHGFEGKNNSITTVEQFSNESMEILSQFVDNLITTSPAMNADETTNIQILPLNNATYEIEEIKDDDEGTNTISPYNAIENSTAKTQETLVEGMVTQTRQLTNAIYGYNETYDQGTNISISSNIDNKNATLTKEQYVTGVQLVPMSSSSPQNVLESPSPSDKESKIGMPADEVDTLVDVIVFPIVAILVIIIILAVVSMRWHVHRTGSHRLDHNRRNMADESEQCKMVMTELGKTQPGHVITVM